MAKYDLLLVSTLDRHKGVVNRALLQKRFEEAQDSAEVKHDAVRLEHKVRNADREAAGVDGWCCWRKRVNVECASDGCTHIAMPPSSKAVVDGDPTMCVSHGGGDICGTEGCNGQRNAGWMGNYGVVGMCTKHGGGAQCLEMVDGEACGALAAPRCADRSGVHNRCRSHGGGSVCRTEGCTRPGGRDYFDNRGVRGMCTKHGGGAQCLEMVDGEACGALAAERSKDNVAGNNKCIPHGGGDPCKTEGCTSQRNRGWEGNRGAEGMCTKHGGGAQCLEMVDGEACGALAAERSKHNVAGNNKCIPHGGGDPVCKTEGCTYKRARVQRGREGNRGVEGMCETHGGGRPCRTEGCTSPRARGWEGNRGARGMCGTHGGGAQCLEMVDGAPCGARAAPRFVDNVAGKDKCAPHGGGDLVCKTEGCTYKRARGRDGNRGVEGMCGRHEGGRRCVEVVDGEACGEACGGLATHLGKDKCSRHNCSGKKSRRPKCKASTADDMCAVVRCVEVVDGEACGKMATKRGKDKCNRHYCSGKKSRRPKCKASTADDDCAGIVLSPGSGDFAGSEGMCGVHGGGLHCSGKVEPDDPLRRNDGTCKRLATNLPNHAGLCWHHFKAMGE